MKAILVMEMPESCIGCPCSDDCTNICNITGEDIEGEGRPYWCPLKPIPERREEICDPLQKDDAGNWRSAGSGQIYLELDGTPALM